MSAKPYLIEVKAGQELIFEEAIVKLTMEGYLSREEAVKCLIQKGIDSDVYYKIEVRLEVDSNKRKGKLSQLEISKEVAENILQSIN